MKDDKESFIAFTETSGFDLFQRLSLELYPNYLNLIELCCYHGAVNCFKFLRTKYNFPITEKCLQYSFLSGNPEIMSECMKVMKPDDSCMRYAIISHNIDFICFLMNEHNIKISLESCCEFKNLQAFLVCLDQCFNIGCLFPYSASFNIPSLCRYLLPFCEDINKKCSNGNTALHYAVEGNSIEIIRLLLSHKAKLNEFTETGKTELHIAAENNCKEVIELLLSRNNKNYRKSDKTSKTGRGSQFLLLILFYNIYINTLYNIFYYKIIPQIQIFKILFT
ncbi:hypothetical protein TVAG_435950 [Trichomonas vaginalis G3]|uniref:DUF3447 domain-containing protein n=1 Tax=Trichomonas vaginalis (strain ATCC PRA-98 / G3) TaxID=412133 RepID=A2FB67_TRIV3|nr:protein of unknown function (DUF3447) [Trichomonas vaginalis G3]EAX97848.1 hypothetical protein TVAG_435950 [Trichomonas vaginalis G3]KAI5541791.1 protein of unknown function (DUF3447) [Trichomonas vaginalis G3]|eukprot:XP_001310778.1 hypothetical protein [Trichomonas vaginalis G3]